MLTREEIRELDGVNWSCEVEGFTEDTIPSLCAMALALLDVADLVQGDGDVVERVRDVLTKDEQAFRRAAVYVGQADAKRMAALEAERDEARDGYHALDRNWETIHNAAMGPIRHALGLPDASVPELVEAIRLAQVKLVALADAAESHAMGDIDGGAMLAAIAAARAIGDKP